MSNKQTQEVSSQNETEEVKLNDLLEQAIESSYGELDENDLIAIAKKAKEKSATPVLDKLSDRANGLDSELREELVRNTGLLFKPGYTYPIFCEKNMLESEKAESLSLYKQTKEYTYREIHANVRTMTPYNVKATEAKLVKGVYVNQEVLTYRHGYASDELIMKAIDKRQSMNIKSLAKAQEAFANTKMLRKGITHHR